MKALKIGLLLDSPVSDKYVYELALWAKDQPNISISHLLVHSRRRDSKRETIASSIFKQAPYDLVSRILFRLISSLETLLLKRSGLHSDHYQLFDLSKIVSGVLDISPIVSKCGVAYQLSLEDIKKIRALDLDLLIRCDSIIPRGDILHASRLGVICLGHGQDRFIPGGAAGFWDCYYERPQTGFYIHRLADEADAGEVLIRGSFTTRYYFSLNQAHLCKKSYVHLQNLLYRIAATGKLPAAESTPNPSSSIRFPSPPRLHQCVAYAIKVIKRILIKVMAKILGFKERWGISLLSGNWDKVEFSRSTEVKLPRGRFWADPFLYTHDGRTFCFVEDLIYKTNRGHITALEIIGTKVVERGIAVKEPFHLSFPFLFKYQNDLYMCPEASESRQIRIYRCTEFPLKWELHSVAMENVSAVDTLLFEKEGRWWMLTSMDQSGTLDHGSELYLFSSDSPLNNHWVPHPQNPIRIDAHGGRNAGLIAEGARLFRIAQRQGFDRYGEGILVYEIKNISESMFTEELVTEINPTFRTGLRGTHHLSTDGKTTVIDHLSYSFVF
jgi:hypothetical protein